MSFDAKSRGAVGGGAEPLRGLRTACCRWGVALALVLVGLCMGVLLCGCAGFGRIVPLVPLPESRMPTQADLAYRPWRVVVADASGRFRAVEAGFVANVKNRLNKFGIQTIASDSETSALIADMLRMQAAAGGEIDIRDPKYEMSRAAGVITVRILDVNIWKNNHHMSWKDDKGKIHHRYDSEVRVTGSVTVAIPKTGVTETIQFSNSDTKTTYEQTHPFNSNAMALNAARAAARDSRMLKPIYMQFPLIGYVMGTGDHPRHIRINRGSNHGVRRDRKWELVMAEVEHNPLVGDMVIEQVIGTCRTVDVQAEYCVVKTDSSRTRERAKLGMKARSIGFGFSWAGFLGGD